MLNHLNQPLKAVITGASQGIGQAMAERLAELGAELFLVARNTDKLKAVAQLCKQKGAKKAEIFSADLSDPESWTKVVEACKTAGVSPNVLINNAGYGLWGDFESLGLDEQLKNLNLNVSSVVSLTHQFLPVLKQNKPAFLMNVSSTSAYQAVPTFSVYAASKSFVLSFTRALHHELVDLGVSVSCLVPGATDTGFIDRAGLQHAAEKAKKVSMTADAVAKSAIDGMLAGKMEIVPGFINQFSAQMVPMLPKGMIERIARSIYVKQ